MAAIGYLMYGSDLLDEVSTNMIKTEGYSRAVKVLVLVLVAVVPITKFPLQYVSIYLPSTDPSSNSNVSAAPIVSTLEVYSRVDPRAALLKPNRFNQSKTLKHLLRAFFRLLVTAVVVILAIEVPSFEFIAALLGCAFGFLICVILPVGFHLKMFHGQMTKWQMSLDCMFIFISVVLGVVGTVWQFLPRGWMGLES